MFTVLRFLSYIVLYIDNYDSCVPFFVKYLDNALFRLDKVMKILFIFS